MEDADSEPEGVNEIEEETQLPLIPGLPDDISMFCLARVPRRYHTALKCVSRRWRYLVCSEEWYAYRRKNNLNETWIYALCHHKFDQVSCHVLEANSSSRSWKRILNLPSSISRRKGMGFEALGKKLYLLGGCGWLEDASTETFCYDASINTWTKGSPLPNARCYFACQVLNEKIYAIGGLGLKSNLPHSWDTFDPSTNNWKSHSDPNMVPEIEDSFVMDGKIYIRCGKSAVTSHVYAVVYEPSSGMWQHADTDMTSGWRGPAVVVDGTLYVLDERSGSTLTMWDNNTREWVRVGRLSPRLTRPPCQLVAIGKSIFVIGKDCGTVVIDVGNVCSMEGVLTGSSIPKLCSDEHVICCKCLAM